MGVVVIDEALMVEAQIVWRGEDALKAWRLQEQQMVINLVTKWQAEINAKFA